MLVFTAMRREYIVRETDHNAGLECGKHPAIPITVNSVVESPMPNMTNARRPHTVITYPVINELAIPKAIPISVIIPVLAEDMPACTRKYGPLVMKLDPITCDRALQ